MNQKSLLDIIEQHAPQTDRLSFEKSGLILAPTKEDVQSIAISVDLTGHVLKEIYKQPPDLLILHHANGKTIEDKFKRFGIGLYVSHLALDTSERGLINSFAEIFGFENLVPLTLKYMGRDIPRSAVFAYSPNNIDFLEKLENYSQNLGLSNLFNIKFSEYSSKYRKSTLDRIAVSMGCSINEHFVRQLKEYDVNLIIAGSSDKNSDYYAKKFEISLLTVGNFESHYPGIKKFAEELEKNTAAYQDPTRVTFIPNYPIKPKRALCKK